MPVGEYLKAHTRRQHRAFVAWLDSQWDRPDLYCQYLMQIAYEVRLANQRLKRNKPRFKDFRLRFKPAQAPAARAAPASAEQAAAWSKAVWLGRMKAAGVKVISVGGEAPPNPPEREG
jgi:hypothetical protein